MISLFRKHKKISSLPTNMNTDQQQKLIWFEHAQKYLQCNRIGGAYAEFGCHEANTFRMALNTLGQYGKPNKIEPFRAFDSFEGMPAPEPIDMHPLFRKPRMNKTELEVFKKLCKHDLHRMEIIKGWYSESLKYLEFPYRFACIYIDCDYYSSTVLVLDFIKHYLQPGCIIAFDDWFLYGGNLHKGQIGAFNKWEKKDQCIEWLPISWGGKSFLYQGN